MSLTSLIKRDKELRDKIKATFSRPKIDKNVSLLAEPQTKKYGLVGTAFDYIFRFYLERLNNTKNNTKTWIAEKALERLSPYKEKQEIGIQLVEKVKELYKEFLITGNISEELIKYTLEMSYLDPIFRVGKGIEYIGTHADKEDIEDIKKLLSLMDNNTFKAKSIYISNPTFGKASQLVGGADADIIIDDMLIDIKTTKNIEFTLHYFCQVIGYLLLYRISGIDGEEQKTEINRLGIYYSRYGYLFTFDVKNLIDNKSLEEITIWFETKIKEN